MKLVSSLSRQIWVAMLLGYTLPAMAQPSAPALPSSTPRLLPSATPSPTPSLPLNLTPNPAPPTGSFDRKAATIFENITLTPAFSPDPETIRGISGGSVTASDLTGRGDTATGPCKGFIDQQPDHRILLTQYFNFLRIQVQSSDDTTLVIRGPGGTWCNDDYSGKNPGIEGQWLSGTYDVWVGSPSENAYYPYVIRLTEQK